MYHIYRQDFLELVDAGENHRAFQCLMKRLKPLEDISESQSPHEMKELCYLLTCKAVAESDLFRYYNNYTYCLLAFYLYSFIL